MLILIISIGTLISIDNSSGPIKKNVILMISDGFGPAHNTFGRILYNYKYYNYTNLNDTFKNTYLDDILVGQIQTNSNSSLVTDSAAAATAFACGFKTYNGAIGRIYIIYIYI